MATSISIAYGAFGLGLLHEGATANDYRYTAQQYDTTLGQYYLRARYYRPSAGRFSSRDPLTSVVAGALTLHAYAYTNNSPVRFSDPSGLCSALAFGRHAHRVIGALYRKAHLLDTVRIDRAIWRPMSLIRPDIINFSKNEIGEIKPLSPYGVASGWLQIAAYQKAAGKLGIALLWRVQSKISRFDAHASNAMRAFNHLWGPGNVDEALRKSVDLEWVSWLEENGEGICKSVATTLRRIAEGENVVSAHVINVNELREEIVGYGRFLAILLLALGASLISGRHIKWRRRTGPLHCGECGYSLFGIESARCPECGSRIQRAIDTDGP
jgi:RHS repeat-associated protein